MKCDDPKAMLDLLRGKASDREKRRFAVACFNAARCEQAPGSDNDDDAAAFALDLIRRGRSPRCPSSCRRPARGRLAQGGPARADLSEADMAEADLHGAALFADLSTADLEDADLTDAITNDRDE